MHIKWTDKHSESIVEHYEVRYDDEKDHTLRFHFDECKVADHRNEFCVKLGPPKIIPGNVYTVSVRGLNGEGPGEWSNEKVFRFKTGLPSKPPQPTVTIQSPTEVLITARRPSEHDEHGSSVTHCKVEYLECKAVNEASWEVLKCPMKQNTSPDVKIEIGSLTPDQTYLFRIKMINDAGESAPSDSLSVQMTPLIPGPPQGLRISSKRRATSIKLRWEVPSKNPRAVYQYKVQCRRVKESEWTNYATVEKKSAKIISLKTDTNYLFRVQFVNCKGQAGEWSDPIGAETRYGTFGRIVGTVAAFVGGTVGGPVIGAVGVAGVAAGKVPDSSVGKGLARAGAGASGAVGGALFGLLGAPLMGGLVAARANMKLTGELDDDSPQTSDDEEPGLMTQMFKNADKMSQSVFDNDKKLIVVVFCETIIIID